MANEPHHYKMATASIRLDIKFECGHIKYKLSPIFFGQDVRKLCETLNALTYMDLPEYIQMWQFILVSCLPIDHVSNGKSNSEMVEMRFITMTLISD